jgi:hypothetical protein
VECAKNAHCQPDTDTQPDPIYVSPYGLCTPDRTCTCSVSVEDTDPTKSCLDDEECPSDAYSCAQDFVGKNHYSCLRSCSAESRDTDSDSTNDFMNGLGCTLRSKGSGSAYVWAPPTTCHAFSRIGSACSGSQGTCSVDGDPGINDGWCIAGKCTYSCANHEYCETDSTDSDSEGCGSSPPYGGLCLP